MPGLQYRPAGTPKTSGADGPYAVTAHRPGPGRQSKAASVLSSVIAHDPGARFAVVNAVLFLATTACRVADLDPTRSLALVLVALCASCLALPLPWALVTGISAWGFVTGFVVNTAGQLTFDTGDLQRAGVFLALAAAASIAAGRPAQILTGS